MAEVAFIISGYLSGSVLYASIFSKVFNKEKLIENSRDGNPGTANAFIYGGFWCGIFTLTGDTLKGFVPVFLYVKYIAMLHENLYVLPLVVSAPVLGHVFSLFYRLRGGKGIATTFGCLSGLLPYWQPVAVLAGFFVFFSLVLRITPHFHRTLMAYFAALISMAFIISPPALTVGFAIITAAVSIRMFASTEEREKMKVKLLWMC